jgi:hypothetical protein
MVLISIKNRLSAANKRLLISTVFTVGLNGVFCNIFPFWQLCRWCKLRRFTNLIELCSLSFLVFGVILIFPDFDNASPKFIFVSLNSIRMRYLNLSSYPPYEILKFSILGCDTQIGVENFI